MKNRRVEIVHPRSGQTTTHRLPSDELLAEAERAMEHNVALNRGTHEAEANEARLDTIRKLREQAAGE